MPSKKDKTSVARKKTVKASPQKVVKKTSKVKKAGAGKALSGKPVPAASSSKAASPKARVASGSKRPDSTKVIPVKKTPRSFSSDTSEASTAGVSQRRSSLDKAGRSKASLEVRAPLPRASASLNVGQSSSSLGSSSLGSSSLSKVRDAGRGRKQSRPARADEVHATKSSLFDDQALNALPKENQTMVESPKNKNNDDSQSSSLSTHSGEPVVGGLEPGNAKTQERGEPHGVNTAKKPFKERRRLENDKYQQGALFMEDVETSQHEVELAQASATGAKKSGQRYAQRRGDKHANDGSAVGQAQTKERGNRRKDWRDDERAGEAGEAVDGQNHNRRSQDEGPAMKQALPAGGESGQLHIKLSNSLYRKLIAKAEMEGVSVDEFAGELLAEGLVLRAWEIMERKSAMRTGNTGNGNSYGRDQQNRQQNRYGFRNNNGPNHNNNNNNYNRNRSSHNGNGSGHGNMSSGGGGRGRMNYSNIMEDSANFLEYVRSQEKKQK